MLAYGLKGIALFGGLFVAVVQSHPAIMGVVISAAVLVDQLMSNHQRLITEQVAVNAVQRTLRRIETDYNDQVLAVIEATSKGKNTKAQDLLSKLAATSTKALRDELDRIHTAVEVADLQYLSALNVEHPTQTTVPKAVTTLKSD